MATFTGTISMSLKGTLIKALDIGTSTLSVSYPKSYTIANGTGAGQANMIWTDTRTIAASTTEDLDLYGDLANAFGDTVNFTQIKGVFIFASSANTNNVIVGGDAASLPLFGAVNDVLSVKPGGCLCVYDPSANGVAVTDTTGDVLQIANSSSGTSVSYDIIIIGEAA